jgi:ComF family protein
VECFCTACAQKIRRIAHPFCTVCGRPFHGGAADDHLCGDCLKHPPFFSQARAWAAYPSRENEEHPLREVVQRFKYGRRVSLGKPLGQLTARACHEFLPDHAFDSILHVPLNPKLLLWRGFNKAVILAREVSRLCYIPMDPFVLTRARATLPQTQLTQRDRRENVRGAFTLTNGKSVRDQRLLVVDDIYTSGATVNECSHALVRGGAREVCVLTLARAE